jgi:fructokinase
MALLVIGEALIDTVRHADGSARSHPGGSPANVAIALGRLGRAPQLLTWLADDPAGHDISRWLAESGVGLDQRSWGAERTTSARADIDGDGIPTYTFDFSWDFRVSDVGAVDLVHFGSVSALSEPGATKLRDLLRGVRADQRATVTYDPNIRPVLVDDYQRARRQVEDFVALADVVKVSEEDLGWLEPGTDPLDVARRWWEQGPALVIVTSGSKGATALASASPVHVASPPVKVADTVGAGDAFMGAVIDGLVSSEVVGPGHRDALAMLTPNQVAELISRAALAAAITVSRPGADPPWRVELDRAIVHLKG